MDACYREEGTLSRAQRRVRPSLGVSVSDHITSQGQLHRFPCQDELSEPQRD